MPPISSHLVAGHVYDIYGVALAGATVSLTHVGQDQTLPSVTSNSSGEYVINLSGLDSQWSKGDSITLVASKTTEGTITVTTTIQRTGGQTVNLTLAETSDLSFYEQERDVYNLHFSLLTHYDGEKVTRERPLPVSSSEIDLLNNPSNSWTITRQDGQPNDETIIIRGTSYKRTFAYNSDGMMISRSEWQKQ